MARPPTIYCPYCNSKGQTQPVLAPMTIHEIQAQDPLIPGQRMKLLAYRCQRCGYGEVYNPNEV